LPDYSLIASWSLIAILWVLMVRAVLHQLKRVLPRQEGLVPFGGAHKRTLGPGRHFVIPQYRFQLVPAGTTTKFHLGRPGVVTERVPGGANSARVLVDLMEIPGRAAREIEVGSPVIVGTLLPPDSVYVTPLRNGTGTSTPR
jgi:hypothetical protein